MHMPARVVDLDLQKPRVSKRRDGARAEARVSSVFLSVMSMSFSLIGLEMNFPG